MCVGVCGGGGGGRRGKREQRGEREEREREVNTRVPEHTVNTYLIICCLMDHNGKCMFVMVCVCEREIEREKWREIQQYTQKHHTLHRTLHTYACTQLHTVQTETQPLYTSTPSCQETWHQGLKVKV